MKFLWSWVPCYGRAASGEEEEAGARMRLPKEDARRPVKRRKRSGSGRGEWTPSLCSITEDRMVLAEKARNREGNASSETKSGPVQVARKSGSGARIHVRRHSSEYNSGVSVTTVIPAFSPTPFIF